MPVRRLPVCPDLEQLKHQAKDLLRAIHEGERAALAELREHHPTPPEPALAKLAYLRLLLGTRIETVPSILSKLEDQKPDSSELTADQDGALIEAFLCFRYGDKNGVLKNITRITDWSRVAPGQRAVAATLLRFSGNDTLAHNLAAALPTLALLTEEQNLWVMTPRQ